MTDDEATIINEALTDIGVGPMFSIDDDSELAEIVANVWPRVMKRTFGMAPLGWSFSRKTSRNNRNAEQPENGYRYAFDLPGGRIGNPIKLWDNPRRRTVVRDFAIEEGKVFCDCPDTWSLCRFYVAPEFWPPDWREGYVLVLGAYFAVPVWQDEDMRDRRLQEAFGTPSRDGTGGLFGRLLAQDVASNPVGEPQEMDNPLSNARYSGTAEPWYGRF